MKLILIDTGALFAFSTPRDQFYQRTYRIIKNLDSTDLKLVTTDYIINETLNTLITARKGGYRPAISLVNWLFNKPAIVKIERVNNTRFFQAVRIFRRYNKDKTWSFTDCVSFVVMKELKIKTAFTFDEHFKQMGIKILE